MKIIGITGGSGAGKTTVTKHFERYDAEIIDADVLAREIVNTGMPALDEIKKEWPGVVVDGILNRRDLAKIVFNDERELHKLNTITHKYVIDEINKRIDKSKKEIFVIDAIALFESGLAHICDATICVIAEKNTRIKRIMERDGLTLEEAQERINAQKSDDFYKENADYVIYNNDDGSNLEEIVNRLS